MASWQRALIFGIAVVLFLVGAGLLWFSVPRSPRAEVQATEVVPTPGPTATPTRPALAALPTAALSPTPSPVPTLVQILPTSTAVASPRPSPTPTISATATALVTLDEAIGEASRFGATGSVETVSRAVAGGLPLSNALTWNVVPDASAAGVQWWQMVRVDETGIRRTSWESIDETLSAYPGSVWLIGNEPDVLWQDNVTPGRYAEIYNELHDYIKSRDPLAQVAIGGVSQPTPLRRQYLDLVLDGYLERFGEPMPIDIWNVHAFTLREEADSWGVGIPPGLEGEEGILYEIEDHNDLEILAQNLEDFRAWMSERDYGDTPLVISEYGILMPEDYGFSMDVVGAFLEGTIDLFQTMANETGYSADDDRLVQWWFWYSVHDDELYPTGNLFEMASDQLTPLGEIWRQRVQQAVEEGS